MMKICPRCLSAYSDEALNFCLVDGTPLVEEEVYKLLQSQDGLDKDDTIDVLIPSAKLTKTHQSVIPTLKLEGLEASSKWKRYSLIVVGILVLAPVIGLIVWSLQKRNPGNEIMPIPQATISLKKNSVSINPEKLDQIKQEIAQTLSNWAQTNSNKDIDSHLANYADILEVYYNESNKDKNYVRADRLRAYKRYNSVSIQVENLQIFVESENLVMAVFDKSWTMKGPERISTGSVQQEMRFTKVNNRWLINSERDLKVYYINNRDLNMPENNSEKSTEPVSLTRYSSETINS